MKFTRANFKEAQRRANSLLEAFWQQRQENLELRKQHLLLLQQHNQTLDEFTDLMKAVAEERLYEVDLMIQRQMSDREYLSRRSLEMGFKHTNYRSN